MPSLIIGAPVLRREWIIERWKDHVLAAAPTNFDIAFAFVGDKTDETFKVVNDKFPSSIPTYLRDIKEPRGYDKREWNLSRYDRMANIRNELLSLVRKLGPDYFLSLDTDILLHPDAIKVLFEDFNGYDAIGGKTYLSERGTNCPTYAYLSDKGLRRSDSINVIMPDVLMAIKLMKPTAYNVDYVSHKQGEDIGWSIAVRKSGYSLAWTGRVASKHVMRPELLEVVDRRVGY